MELDRIVAVPILELDSPAIRFDLPAEAQDDELGLLPKEPHDEELGLLLGAEVLENVLLLLCVAEGSLRGLREEEGEGEGPAERDGPPRDCDNVGVRRDLVEVPERKGFGDVTFRFLDEFELFRPLLLPSPPRAFAARSKIDSVRDTTDDRTTFADLWSGIEVPTSSPVGISNLSVCSKVRASTTWTYLLCCHFPDVQNKISAKVPCSRNLSTNVLMEREK